jgi:GxxExxY protein
MDANSRRLDEISNRVIGAALTVSNTLGVGFLEKVYENALAHELRKAGLAVEQQKVIQVEYDGVIVGDYVADILVEGDLLVELKAVKALDEIHMAQCMNYLKATGRRLCMLLNFGNTKLQIKRVVRNF